MSGSPNPDVDGFAAAGVIVGAIGFGMFFAEGWMWDLGGSLLLLLGVGLWWLSGTSTAYSREAQAIKARRRSSSPPRLESVGRPGPMGLACPGCGSVNFMPRRSFRRRLGISAAALVAGAAGGVGAWAAAGKDLVECVACGAVYRR